ncbi:MAG: thioredoxin family protein [Phycisphaerae bacterium]|nr:thioredoxin family protein [Phycisphaerae bacterium]
MAMTPSTMRLALGSFAPGFRLRDHAGRWVDRADFSSAKALVVMFICNHCPFVKHVRAELARLGRDYQSQGVAFVAINSNDVEAYPDDSPEKMAIEARDAGYTFPYLFDADQSVAKAYAAACTPDFFVFDGSGRLVYRGQLDDSRPPGRSSASTIPVTGRDLRAALDAVLAGRPLSTDQRPSIGCNIKWKPGNEPDFG